MDKGEYKIRSQEILSMISQGRYADAVKIADTIDWRKVRNNRMLCTISDLYKINRRLEESKDILLMAYERNPGARDILFSLSELCLKLGDVVAGMEYFKQFVNVAPHDTGRYILQYKLYEAEGVSAEERIAVLEELKEHEYVEKWAYELAVLYNRVGLTTECIEEVDEMFIYFGEGRYVMKALELKMLHEPLSPEQQAKYDLYRSGQNGRLNPRILEEEHIDRSYKQEEPRPVNSKTREFYTNPIEVQKVREVVEKNSQNNGFEEFQVRTPDVANKYNTINLQQALAESMNQIMSQPEEPAQGTDTMYDTMQDSGMYEAQTDTGALYGTQQTDAMYVPQDTAAMYDPVQNPQPQSAISMLQQAQGVNVMEAPTQVLPQPTDYEAAAMAAGNLQAQETWLTEETGPMTPQPEAFVPSVDETQIYQPVGEETQVYQPVGEETQVYQPVGEETQVYQPAGEETQVYQPAGQETQVYQPATEETRIYQPVSEMDLAAQQAAQPVTQQPVDGGTTAGYVPFNQPYAPQDTMQMDVQAVQQELQQPQTQEEPWQYDPTYDAAEALGYDPDEEQEPEMNGNMRVIRPQRGMTPQSHFDQMLAEEYDGQISMVVPEKTQVEKQITGQISINDIMNRIRSQQRLAQAQKVREHVMQETGDMFADFDEKTRADLQLRIEKAVADALRKERAGKEPEADSQVHTGHTGEIVVPDQNAEPFMVGGKVVEIPPETDEYEEFTADLAAEQVNAELEAEAEEAEPVEEEAAEESEVSEVSEASEVSEEFEVSEESEDVAVEDSAKEPVEEETPEEESANGETSAEEPSEEEAEQPEEEVNPEASEEEEPAGEDTEEAEESAEETAENSEETAETVEEAEESAAEAETKTPETDGSALERALEQELEAAEQGEADAAEPDKAEEPHKKAPEAAPLHPNADSSIMADRVRAMTPEEKDLFGPYIHHRKSRRQIIKAIDGMGLAAYTGNVIVTGDEGAGTIDLAKGLLRSVQVSDSNFTGRLGAISGDKLNHKNVEEIVEKLEGGALIIQHAADLREETCTDLYKSLQSENRGIIVVLEDGKEDMNRFLGRNPQLKECFNVRVDIDALDDEALVAYAKQYALEKEHAVDNFGVLALHNRIENMQTIDHGVTISEVRDIIDDAIYYADKKTLGHFFDILTGKRYDKEDMIVLREKDFMHG